MKEHKFNKNILSVDKKKNNVLTDALYLLLFFVPQVILGGIYVVLTSIF